MAWIRKDLLGLEDLNKEEIELILNTAESFKEVSTREIKKVPALRGKTVVNLFYEPSTRTRVSFEVAAKRLSADVINIAAQESSVRKGETLIDTGRNIEALKADIIVIRHGASGAAAILARHVSVSVINAGDGWHEHPTQALLDIFTLKPSMLPNFSFKVKMSKSACVGCSCQPSPALITLTLTLRANIAAAPEALCLITMMSAFRASMFLPVSMRVSPLRTLDS